MKHSLSNENNDLFAYDDVYNTLALGIQSEYKREALSSALNKALAVHAQRNKRPSSIEVSLTLKQLSVDCNTLIATLLSDPRLREHLDIESIKDEYGETISNIVNHIHWLNTFKDCTKEVPKAPEEAETLRRMLLATVDDIRAVLAKLAYRVQRLRNLPYETSEVRRCIARETMDVYSPLANRLGVSQLKWEMEDLSFRHLEPETYKSLAKLMEGKRVERESYIRDFADRLLDQVRKIGVQDPAIDSRAKHIYSAWKKMQRKSVGIEDIADLLAVRVIVKSIPECYMILGMAHYLWKHLPHEFDDYIANPKSNGYQSIHTAVIGPKGRIVEIQIRTEEMQEFAENGVAAHWRYKEGSQQDIAMEQTIGDLRGMLENLEESESDELLHEFQSQSFTQQVFVMTPKGDVITLIAGATPLDFAYSIHSDLGHRTRGARVNGNRVALNYQLKSGERVEVITTSNIHPSHDWLDERLGYIASSRARSCIRSWFNKQSSEDTLKEGEKTLSKETQRLGLSDIDKLRLANHLGYDQENAMLKALGKAKISTSKLARTLNLTNTSALKPKIDKGRQAEKLTQSSILGVGNLAVQQAECCRPQAGNPIVGFVTNSKQIIIHRQDCQKTLRLPEEDLQQFIKVSWGSSPEKRKVKIHIDAFDRKALLKDITEILSKAEINTLKANTKTDPNNLSVKMKLLIEVESTEQLSLALDQISVISNVFSVSRSD